MGCGRHAPRRLLRRHVLEGERVVADPEGTRPGRGAYLHADRACLELAVRRRGFQRSFRRAVTLQDLL